VRASTAIVNLLKAEPEWRQFFKQCCETSPLRLRSQAWQWRDELADRGNVFSTADVEDVLMGLARKVFPESPAAQWDTEWADSLLEGALKHLAELYSGLSKVERDALDLYVQDPYEEAMVAAGEANDPAAFRTALKGWERASLEALDEAREGKGAA
jgi:hypothetical protein